MKGHNLRLEREPTSAEFKSAIGNPKDYKEVVFCGFGEPLIRLDVVKEVARWVKDKGGRVRVNTNGQARLIHKRDVLPELAGILDEVSVSLNDPDAQTYERLCVPEFEGSFEAVCEFIRDAGKHIPTVRATVVSAPGVDIERAKALARELGAELQVRSLDVVG